MGSMLCVTRVLTAPASNPETHTLVRACSRCGTKRDFCCSGRFRVNAQKKRLDVWLIYRCAHCSATWNRPVHERTTAAEIGADRLARFMANDAEEVTRCTGGTASEVQVAKSGSTKADAMPDTVKIILRLDTACSMRLDRLLALELGVARNRLKRFVNGKALRRPPRDGQEIVIDLGTCGAHAPEIAARAVG